MKWSISIAMLNYQRVYPQRYCHGESVVHRTMVAASSLGQRAPVAGWETARVWDPKRSNKKTPRTKSVFGDFVHLDPFSQLQLVVS